MSALAALVPFLAKPFNMDDPLFIWAARQIQTHPTDPYGFAVNWFGAATPMWQATQNPPLASYYLALAAKAVGWSEVGLHAALLVPALAVILGTHRLARYFCSRPLLAAFLTLLTPAFLVSSTTVMCDVLMLAFWVWAAVLWVEGLDRGGPVRLAGAGLLMALAELTKYFGASLILLAAAYAVVCKRHVGAWSAWLLIPVGALGAYCWATRALYGRILLIEAADYTSLPTGLFPLFVSKMGPALITLAFTGGCLAVASFLAPLVLRPRTLAIIAGTTVLLAVAVVLGNVIQKEYGRIEGSSPLFIEAQIGFWAIGGVCLLTLAIGELWRVRDAGAWLLTLWIVGTFVFAAIFNWTVNGRSILPMTPAVGILIARRMERLPAGRRGLSLGASVGLVSGAVLALLVTGADYVFARAVRESARQTHLKYGHAERFWFQGHWGFQYYMEQLGATALDGARTPLQRGDVIAWPLNNTNFVLLKPELLVLRDVLSVRGPRWLATMKGEVGAGFYASRRGPLPFAFGSVPPELVLISQLEPPARAPARESAPEPR